MIVLLQQPNPTSYMSAMILQILALALGAGLVLSLIGLMLLLITSSVSRGKKQR
jgi:hypothetical protein